MSKLFYKILIYGNLISSIINLALFFIYWDIFNLILIFNLIVSVINLAVYFILTTGDKKHGL